MIKAIFKRGFIGAILSLVTILTFALSILIIWGDNEITLQTNIIFKYVLAIVTTGFILSASSIIFEFSKISLIMKAIIHFVIVFTTLKIIIMCLGILVEDYLIQAIFVSLYVIIAAISFGFIVSENRKDVKFINEKLKVLNK